MSDARPTTSRNAPDKPKDCAKSASLIFKLPISSGFQTGWKQNVGDVLGGNVCEPTIPAWCCDRDTVLNDSKRYRARLRRELTMSKTARHHWCGDSSPWIDQQLERRDNFHRRPTETPSNAVIWDRENPPGLQSDRDPNNWGYRNR